MGMGGSMERRGVKGPLRRGSERSLGGGPDKPLQNKMERFGLGLLGVPAERRSRKRTISQSLPCQNCPEECFTMEKPNVQF